jgi:hypothetical protein
VGSLRLAVLWSFATGSTMHGNHIGNLPRDSYTNNGHASDSRRLA